MFDRLYFESFKNPEGFIFRNIRHMISQIKAISTISLLPVVLFSSFTMTFAFFKVDLASFSLSFLLLEDFFPFNAKCFWDKKGMIWTFFFPCSSAVLYSFFFVCHGKNSNSFICLKHNCDSLAGLQGCWLCQHFSSGNIFDHKEIKCTLQN
jgi:hypothetical protein